MNIFVLLYNSGTDNEGIHSIELKGRTIVLMFEDKDDATRYCGLLEAQDFPLPTVETINIEEIKDFCIKLDYECKLVEKNFVPKTAEDRLLISPPQKNLEVENWEEDKTGNQNNIDINTIKENLEKLLYQLKYQNNYSQVLQNQYQSVLLALMHEPQHQSFLPQKSLLYDL